MLSYLNDSYSFRTSLHILFYIMDLLLLFSVVVINSYEIDNLQPEKTDDGEKFYGELIEKAKNYGGCWKKALIDIDSDCRTLNEDKNSRLALSFSSCLRKHAGLRPIACPTNELISDCLKRISDQEFITYSEFYTHTQRICHYLQYREWQEETAKTVLILTENSLNVSKKLDQTVAKQSEVLDLLNHSEMHSRTLNAELQLSRKTVQSLQMEVNSVSDQNLQLFGTFHEVKRLMDNVFGFFHTCLTIGYFLFGGVFSLILTSPCQTYRARWPMLIATLFSYFIVYSYSLLVNYYSEENLVTNEILYERIWWCIKICCALWIIILIYYWYHYKDQNEVYSELKELILQMNKELKETRGILKSRQYVTEKNRSFLIQELDSVDESGYIDQENSFVENSVLQDIGNVCLKRRRESSERLLSNESPAPNSPQRSTRLSSHLR